MMTAQDTDCVVTYIIYLYSCSAWDTVILQATSNCTSALYGSHKPTI